MSAGENWKAWRRKKLAEGLCTECGKAPLAVENGSCRCDGCIKKRSSRRAELKNERLKKQLCPLCGTKPEEGFVNCSKCRQNTNKRKRGPRRTKSRQDKLKFIEMYGGKCACCGEMNVMFLTADHINRDGAKERRKRRVKYAHFLQVKRDDIQILCFNCNCGRELNGGLCPHKGEITKC